MTGRTVANIMDKTGKSADEALAALTSTNPQHRLIAPSEVTATALWLCAPGAEGVNGQAIVLNGGAP
jgi:NAD(P)-dependent dehydrogenase (short-subunit alcohol dehydrogenase family)